MKKKSLLKKLLVLFKGEERDLTITIIFSVIVSIMVLIWPVLARRITTEFVNQPPAEAIKNIAICAGILAVMIITEVITEKVRILRASVMTDRIKGNIQGELFKKFSELPYEYYDKNKTGDMMQYMDTDVDALDSLLFLLPNVYTKIVIQIAGVCVIFASLNYKLLILVIPFVIGRLVFLLKFSGRMRESRKEMRKEQVALYSYIEDRISGIRTMISFGTEDKEYRTFCEKRDTLNASAAKCWRNRYIYKAANGFFCNIVDALVLVVGSVLAIRGEITVIDLLFFYSNTRIINNPIETLSEAVDVIQSGFASMERLETLLAMDPVIKNSKNSIIREEIGGEIEFNDVSFKYEDDVVIRNLDLRIEAGEFVAIAGPSGGGKSTLASIIPRYYDTCEGTVTVDGVNIRDLDLHSLRTSIGCVQQDVYLFDGTVYDNIAYGVEDATMEQVIEAAKLANADEFISKLKDGYNSEVGEDGVKLSGGQRQRIAIARLFLTNPKVLIFDEATSALDNVSERKIQAAMERLAKGRTTIVIAHRLSTIQNADRILYLEDGKIIEQGSHKKLLSMKGKYADLYEVSKQQA